MHLPQSFSHPFHVGHQNDTTSTWRTDAPSPVPSRPPERRKSKFLEDILGEEKLDLRSGEESETFDSIINPPAQRTDQDTKRSGPWIHMRRPEMTLGDPFGNEEGVEMKYKTMTWWQAALVMAAEIISLGIFTLPLALSTLGFVPGVILIVGSGILSTYTGYVFWRFRIAHSFVHNMADIGEILGGRLGRESLGVAQMIFLIFAMGRHIIFFNVSFNKTTNHATCTVVWAVIALLLGLIITIPRTFKSLSHLTILALLSILATLFITLISIGISPPAKSRTHATTHATTHPNLATAFLSVSSIIFSYSSHITIFPIISELRKPQDFPKALLASQTSATIIYLVVAVVTYCYAGDTLSPLAIDNASPVLQKVAYGFALPSIVIAGAIYAHVATKDVYLRIFRGTSHMHSKTARSIGTWLLIVLGLWLLAFVLAESIPDYGYLFGLICAIFTSWFTYGLAGVLWLFLHAGTWRRKMLGVLLHFAIVLVAVAMMGLGVYASGKAMHDDGGRRSWTCGIVSSRSW